MFYVTAETASETKLSPTSAAFTVVNKRMIVVAKLQRKKQRVQLNKTRVPSRACTVW